MIQGGLKKKSKANSEIPSSSLADMAFLLLIFFMVSTTFPKERPRRLPFPEAEASARKLGTNSRRNRRDAAVFRECNSSPMLRARLMMGLSGMPPVWRNASATTGMISFCTASRRSFTPSS